MSARAERLRTGITGLQETLAKTTTEAAWTRKIATDLIAAADKLDERAAWQDRQIADWQALLRDEEERA